eukprot:c39606_g1_i1.p1 GENE.c39606_g1_i1~~c39606_g1_i1.p1  ORF type:complete len:474 (+),score=106.79 c39606_g1_i1:119-1423(+)
MAAPAEVRVVRKSLALTGLPKRTSVDADNGASWAIKSLGRSKGRSDVDGGPAGDMPLSAFRYSTPQTLSVGTLVDGYPQAFVDFFRLTHRPKRMQLNPETNAEEEVEPPVLGDAELEALKGNLVAIEEHSRRGEWTAVLSANINLADYFEEEGDIGTAIGFHVSSMAIGAKTGNAAAEGYANCRLGMCYERLTNADLAISYYEKYHALSSSEENRRDACAHLVNTYMTQARLAEKRGHYALAIEHYKACMSKAVEGGDADAEGETNFRIGHTFDVLGDFDASIVYFKAYLDVCRRTKNTTGEGKGLFALARAHQKIGDLATAVQFLEQYVALAEATNQMEALCEAASSLGIIYNQKGEYEKAVLFFNKNFDMAVRIGKVERIDSARVLLGISLGHQHMDEYLRLVDTPSDRDSLLRLVSWKNERAQLSPSAIEL